MPRHNVPEKSFWRYEPALFVFAATLVNWFGGHVLYVLSLFTMSHEEATATADSLGGIWEIAEYASSRLIAIVILSFIAASATLLAANLIEAPRRFCMWVVGLQFVAYPIISFALRVLSLYR